MSVFETVLDLESPKAQASTDALLQLGQRLQGEAPKTILEICQSASHMSLCLAAVLKDNNAGTLTTFHASSGQQSAIVNKQAQKLGLNNFISPVLSGRSYTWALQRLLKQGPLHTFDVCVLNGNKSWDASGFGLLMADMMLRKGGLMILCGRQWSMAKSPYFQNRPQVTKKYGADELNAQPVQLVMDMVLPHLGYETIDSPETTFFGFARKR